MTRKTVMIVAGTLSASVLMAGTAMAGFGERQNDRDIPKPSVTVESAIKIAKASHPGTVEETFLDDFQDKPVWIVSLADATSDAEIIIDGTSGQILTTMSVTSASADIHDALIGDFDDAFDFDEADLCAEDDDRHDRETGSRKR